MKFESLSKPILDDAPCGQDIRRNTNSRDLYLRIKDSRNMARAAERNVEPGQSVGISPIWGDVNNLGLQLLGSHSKDIEVLAWLMEAQLRLEGFSGLRNIYDVTASLLEQHFDGLHSIGNDDPEERFAPFAGLNGIGSEGTLIQAIRLAPLTPNAKFGQNSLWDFQVAQRPGEDRARETLQQAAQDVGAVAMTGHFNTIKACIALFDRINEILTERCGSQAPPSSNTRNALLEAAAAVKFLGRVDDQTDAPAIGVTVLDPAAASRDEQQPTASATRQSFDRIGSREEAFEVLLLVARYFRKTEPHSPLSMSIETLVRRGRMDFSQLLAELMPDANQRQAVMSAAGIRQMPDSM